MSSVYEPTQRRMHRKLKTATTSVAWQGDYYFYHHANHQSSSYRHMHADIKTLLFFTLRHIIYIHLFHTLVEYYLRTFTDGIYTHISEKQIAAINNRPLLWTHGPLIIDSGVPHLNTGRSLITLTMQVFVAMDAWTQFHPYKIPIF